VQRQRQRQRPAGRRRLLPPRSRRGLRCPARRASQPFSCGSRLRPRTPWCSSAARRPHHVQPRSRHSVRAPASCGEGCSARRPRGRASAAAGCSSAKAPRPRVPTWRSHQRAVRACSPFRRRSGRAGCWAFSAMPAVRNRVRPLLPSDQSCPCFGQRLRRQPRCRFELGVERALPLQLPCRVKQGPSASFRALISGAYVATAVRRVCHVVLVAPHHRFDCFARRRASCARDSSPAGKHTVSAACAQQAGRRARIGQP
jgi:hypothetical protein